MALINGLYVFVESESVGQSIESTSHSTETGLPTTSTIKQQPLTLSLSGRIVNTDKYDAATIKAKLQELMYGASMVSYVGRNSLKSMQIQSFNTEHPNTIWGGMSFSMELKQTRTAKSGYTAKQKTPTTTKQKEAKKQNPTLKVGATVVFKGGSVYVSSDAKKAAANRGRSTCKITKINTKSWAKHQYHLISTDGKKVYGWVDKSNIEGVGTSSTSNKTNSGTKQVAKGNGKAVYHTVKAGDTVYRLVTKNYKSLGKSVQWVIDNNPKAFSRKGDPTTLQIGKKLLMGYK